MAYKGMKKDNAVVFYGILIVALSAPALVNSVAWPQSSPQGGQETCPNANEISPCVCTVKKNGLDILCESTDFHKISNAMTVLKGKSPIIFYLKLRHNNLPKLQGFVFLALEIHHLTIHNSSLAAIEESALSSLGKGLTQLDVSLNQLSNVPSSALKNLHHLLILNLNHNKIVQIHDQAFEGLDNLEILSLYENKINSVEPNAFKGLEKKLKRLNLGGNGLTKVPQRSLQLLDNLKKLEIQENKIEHIVEDDFSGLHNLDSLILAHNRLKEVPAKAFRFLSQLNSLELEGNLISSVDKEGFVGLEENLQYLRLGDNKIHSVPSEALQILHRLRHLDLRNNEISTINEDAFSKFGDSLTFLNLQKNNIKVLPMMLFENLNSLETLNIQNNKLTRLPEELMEPLLDSMKVVDITDNPLICSCELMWFPNLLQSLKDRDEEMQQKKKPLCHFGQESREYYVQNMPVEKMDCVITRSSKQNNGSQLQSFFLLNIINVFLVKLMLF